MARDEYSTARRSDRRVHLTGAKNYYHYMANSKIDDLDDAVSRRTAFLFDLDGTLVDSVYQHVLAWREALEAGGIRLAVWRIHRQIGMSGGLFVNALLRETGHTVSGDEAERLQGRRHCNVVLALSTRRQNLAKIVRSAVRRNRPQHIG